MAGSIERRVAALEASAGGSGRCPECGNGPDDDKRPYEIVFVDPGDASRDEWCQTCGQALSLTIHMDWEGQGA
jgi:hypothetical protein